VKAWRVCKKARAATALDGEGARRNGGRWNHKGVPIVYCASTLALAMLEILVHLDSDELPDDYVSIELELPDDGAEILAVGALPASWRKTPGPAALQDIGDEWAKSGRSLALHVPSAIVPEEWNVLLNPKHADVVKIVQQPPRPLTFDPRLRKP
jgi:RES domain-containing protein